MDLNSMLSHTWSKLMLPYYETLNEFCIILSKISTN